MRRLSKTDYHNREFVIEDVDIRHNLDNYFLASYGGHIGYSVCPSERRKGYAVQMLGLTLEYAKYIHLSRVMLGCYFFKFISIPLFTLHFRLIFFVKAILIKK